MKKIYRFIPVCFLFFTGSLLAQTDPHFSQYYAYPGFLNPALTGVIDGDYRVTAMYRSQWGNVDGGFKTPGITADFKTNKNVNFGVNVMNQSSAGGVFNHLNTYASFAFTGIRFGTQGNHHIVLGLSAGAISRKINPAKFTTGSQWTEAGGLNPDLPTNEAFVKNSSTNFDAGVGALYFDATPGRKANIFAGFSAYHLTQPSDDFMAATNSKLPVRYTVHGGIRLSLSPTFSLVPQIIYMRQGNAEEKMAGAYGQLMVNEATQLLLGFNYRYKDAVVPYIGIGYNNFVFGASYDVTTSSLGRVAGNVNSFELSLSFLGRKKGQGISVPFVCPRL